MENDDWFNGAISFTDGLAAMIDENKKLRKALEFYADEDNFKFKIYNGEDGFNAGFIHFVCEINGIPAWLKAREALGRKG